MYSKTVKTTRVEKYTCDTCGKTAEFMTAWNREHSEDSVMTTEPDYGTWDRTAGEITFHYSARSSVPIDVVTCSEECRHKAIVAVLADKKKD
jgi:hypothetical protein